MAGMLLHAPSCETTALVLRKSITSIHRALPKVSEGESNI